MTTVEFHIADQPSRSKGWARYAASTSTGNLITSRTGNSWVSADHSGEAADGTVIELTCEVELNTGKGRRARRERSSQQYQLVAEAGSSCEIEFRPGSQGLRLAITGARRVL